MVSVNYGCLFWRGVSAKRIIVKPPFTDIQGDIGKCRAYTEFKVCLSS